MLHSLLIQYLANVEQHADIIASEKTCPVQMDRHIGSILCCVGKVDVDELPYV